MVSQLRKEHNIYLKISSKPFIYGVPTKGSRYTWNGIMSRRIIARLHAVYEDF